MEGWVKVHRQIWEWDKWFEYKFTPAQAWIDMILMANHKPGRFRVRGNLVKVERGQLGKSIVTLAHRWKWSRTAVTNFLNELEGEQQIRQQKSNKTTIVTILNYENYQGDKAAEWTAEKQQKSTNKNNKNEKKEYSSSFLSFWNEYPNKGGKYEAYKSWQKVDPSLSEEIMSKLEAFKQTDNWKKEGGRYIPMAATWLNQRRWEDDIEKPKSNMGVWGL